MTVMEYIKIETVSPGRRMTIQSVREHSHMERIYDRK